VNTALYYGPLMMESAGVKIAGLSDDESSLILNIPLGFANFLGNIVCVLYIDKLGRRGVMLRALPIMSACWLVAAIGMSFTGDGRSESSQEIGGYFVVGAIFLFLFFFAIGMGSPPWALNAEIYPLHLIGTANSMAASSNWIANFAVSESFKVIMGINLTAQVIMYFMLCVFGALAWVFVFYLIPETANKPIEQILEDILGADFLEKEKKRNSIRQ